MTRAKKNRLLAIDPTTKGFAWALLEGGTVLVEWGTAQARPPKNENSLKVIVVLLDRFRPDTVVLEDLTAAEERRSARVEALLDAIEEAAQKKHIASRRVARKQAFAVLGVQTKFQCSLAIAARFPELRFYLPKERRPWMSEDSRMNVFDAIGLAIAVSLAKRA